MADQVLTLEQAISLGLSDNRTLQQANYDSAIARIGVGIEDDAFRFITSPVVRTEANREGVSGLVGVNASQLLRTGQRLSGTVGASVFNSDGEDSTPLGVVVQIEQPLFRRSGALIAEAGLDAAQRQDRRLRRTQTAKRAELALEVARRFTGLLELEGKIAAGQKAQERVERFRRLVAARESVGKLSRVDTLQAELQLGQVRAVLENDLSALQAARESFVHLLGQPPGTVFTLVTPPVLEYPQISVAAALDVAYRNRVELAQARDDEDGMHRSLAVAQRGVLPDLRLTVGYRDLSLFENPTAFEADGAFIGVSAGLDFDRSRAEGRLLQERLRLDQSAHASNLQREQIEREVIEAVREQVTALAGQKLADQNLQFAHRQLELARRLFEIGREDAFTVSRAEEQLLQTELAQLASGSRRLVAAYALAKAAGTLLETPETAALTNP